MRRSIHALLVVAMLVSARCATAQDPAPAAKPAVGKFPGVNVDVKAKQVRVDCEALNVDIRLEFFCVLNGTNEHESALRSIAKPSDIHTALLMLGLTPGEPVKYSDATQKWLPPHGPPLHINCEFEKDGKIVSVPANRLIRNATTKQTPKAFTFIFAGSRVLEDGKYAADVTGYTVSVVNFDLTLIDVPELASNANESLEWEYNPDTMPKAGTKVTMIIEPAGSEAVAQKPAGAELAAPPAVQPAKAADPSAAAPADAMSDVQLDEKKMAELKARWEKAVRPNAEALRIAAQAHYEVIGAMRKEQQRLINEADRIQRAMDELEKDYQNMTTPRPEK